jgi:hypothetical protein
MTRGRHTNTARLYQRVTGDHEYGVQEPDGTHVKYRGSSHDAAGLVRGILANHDQPAVTAHDYATLASAAALPERVRRLLERRRKAVDRRQQTYEAWSAEARNHAQYMEQARARAANRSRDRSRNNGIEF